MSIILNDEDFAIIRDMLQHEDNLINHRITWMCQIQGLLFAAFGILIQRNTNSIPNNNNYFMSIIILMGIFISIVSYVSIHIAELAGKDLCNLAGKDLCKSPRQRLRGIDVQEKIMNAKNKEDWKEYIFWYCVLYLLPWRNLPYVFIIAWLLIALHNIGKIGPYAQILLIVFCLSISLTVLYIIVRGRRKVK